ncbi:MAG: hypothetical protein AMJ72_06620 [Acidithiobacillales bacterium SM1_46]|nr:MAG: hypothetical protein AMJ72_06620 [Acidithiobacillales bacterium SM1_46]
MFRDRTNRLAEARDLEKQIHRKGQDHRQHAGHEPGFGNRQLANHDRPLQLGHGLEVRGEHEQTGVDHNDRHAVGGKQRSE